MKRYFKEILYILAVSAGMLAIVGILLLRDYGGKREKRQIDLSGEQTLDLEKEAERGRDKENPFLSAPDAEDDGVNRMEAPEILLSLAGEFPVFSTSMWRSADGVCYFFLPDFCRGRTLILQDMKGGSLKIGDSLLEEKDNISGVIWNEAYEMAFYDKDGIAVLEAPLVFLCSSKIPAVQLTTKSGSMEQIDAEKEEGESGAVTVFDAQGKMLYDGKIERISGRGNSTWGLLKKPYQIKLAESVDLFGFGKAKSYNLLANGYDETKLRNRIAEELAVHLGMAYVPQGQMVDLYINGVYYGNYYLTEKIRVGAENVDIKDMEQYTGQAYTKEDREGLTRRQSEDGSRKWVEVQHGQDDISGGYLFERELESRYQEESSGFLTEEGDCYVLQSPKYASKDQVDYIAGLMQEFQTAAAQKDGVNPATGKHYSEYIDIESFAQKYLVEEISKNYDGGVTSSFFYKPQDAVSEKIYAGPIWDYDVAFGNCNLDKIASNPLGITKLDRHIYSTALFSNLYGQEEFYGTVVKLYREEALPYLDYLVAGGIDAMAEETEDSVRMDNIRWEALENRYRYYQAYENDIRYLKYFIEARRDFLSGVWLEGETYHDVNYVVDGEIWKVDCVKDGEMPPSEPLPVRYASLSVFLGWETKDGVPFDGYKPIYEDITYYAKWQEAAPKEEGEEP